MPGIQKADAGTEASPHREENGATLLSPCQEVHTLALAFPRAAGLLNSLHKEPLTSLEEETNCTNCSRDSKENQSTLFMGKPLLMSRMSKTKNNLESIRTFFNTKDVEVPLTMQIKSILVKNVHFQKLVHQRKNWFCILKNFIHMQVFRRNEKIGHHTLMKWGGLRQRQKQRGPRCNE